MVFEARYRDFLQGPRPRGLQAAAAQSSKLPAVFGLHARRMPQPAIAPPLQLVIPCRLQDLVFLAPHPIQGIPEMLRDMELVERDQPRPTIQIFPYRAHIQVPHVHGNGPDPRPLRLIQRRPEAIQALMRPVLSNVQHPPPFRVIHQREVPVFFAARFLIHPKYANGSWARPPPSRAAP